MDAELAYSLAIVAGLLVLAGCGLDVVMRPLPVLAPAAQRVRRHAFWAILIALYLGVMLVI